MGVLIYSSQVRCVECNPCPASITRLVEHFDAVGYGDPLFFKATSAGVQLNSLHPPIMIDGGILESGGGAFIGDGAAFSDVPYFNGSVKPSNIYQDIPSSYVAGYTTMVLDPATEVTEYVSDVSWSLGATSTTPYNVPISGGSVSVDWFGCFCNPLASTDTPLVIAAQMKFRLVKPRDVKTVSAEVGLFTASATTWEILFDLDGTQSMTVPLALPFGFLSFQFGGARVNLYSRYGIGDDFTAKRIFGGVFYGSYPGAMGPFQHPYFHFDGDLVDGSEHAIAIVFTQNLSSLGLGVNDKSLFSLSVKLDGAEIFGVSDPSQLAYFHQDEAASELKFAVLGAVTVNEYANYLNNHNINALVKIHNPDYAQDGSHGFHSHQATPNANGKLWSFFGEYVLPGGPPGNDFPIHRPDGAVYIEHPDVTVNGVTYHNKGWYGPLQYVPFRISSTDANDPYYDLSADASFRAEITDLVAGAACHFLPGESPETFLGSSPEAVEYDCGNCGSPVKIAIQGGAAFGVTDGEYVANHWGECSFYKRFGSKLVVVNWYQTYVSGGGPIYAAVYDLAGSELFPPMSLFGSQTPPTGDHCPHPTDSLIAYSYGWDNGAFTHTVTGRNTWETGCAAFPVGDWSITVKCSLPVPCPCDDDHVILTIAGVEGLTGLNGEWHLDYIPADGADWNDSPCNVTGSFWHILTRHPSFSGDSRVCYYRHTGAFLTITARVEQLLTGGAANVAWELRYDDTGSGGSNNFTAFWWSGEQRHNRGDDVVVIDAEYFDDNIACGASATHAVTVGCGSSPGITNSVGSLHAPCLGYCPAGDNDPYITHYTGISATLELP